jgi:hypothetical protein
MSRTADQKLTLVLVAAITLEVAPFRAYAPFPALLPFLKCVLEVLFSEGLQHHLRSCIDKLNVRYSGMYQGTDTEFQ